MARPSLQASRQGLQLAQEAFTKQRWTQETLAEELGCYRTTISKFLKGETILQENFISISEKLGLDWHEIAALSKTTEQELAESSGKNYPEINPLAQEVRTKVKASIQEWCGTMRILYMTHPIELSEIYTDVNILKKLTANRRKTIPELIKESNLEDFETFGLGGITGERVTGLSAVEQYKKLIVLGKPGSGKTTFLRYLAIQCNQGNFKQNLVPIFIPLKYFAEVLDQPTLLEYIAQQFSECGVTLEQIHDVLKHNSALVLLDGLDEVSEEYHERTLKEVRDFSRKFFGNHIIIACRIAAWEYTFDKFTEVEIADFSEPQIQTFVNKWFKNSFDKSKKLVEQLTNNKFLKQITVNPLLLTLLCLVFEESGNLPDKRYHLYEEGLDILLEKWDEKRGIQRDRVYKYLSVESKKDLLSEIAFTTLKEDKYFFKPQDVKKTLDNYIIQPSKGDIDSEVLQLDIEAILNSIEAQHGLLVERATGIYSFSHLTFHEYLTFREIVRRQSSDTNVVNEENVVNELLQYVGKKRWTEIFLLTIDLLTDPSMLLEKILKKIKEILSEDKLQQYINFVQDFLKKEYQLKLERVDREQVAIFFFWFDIDFEIDQERRLSLLLDPQTAKYLVFGSFLARVLENTDFATGVTLAQDYDKTYDKRNDRPFGKISQANSADEVMYIAVKYALAHPLLKLQVKKSLEEIDCEKFGKVKIEKLDRDKLKLGANKARELARNIKKIGDDKLRFPQEYKDDEELKELCQKCYIACTILVECLKNCLERDIVSPKVPTKEILEKLLSSVAGSKIS